MHTLLLTEFVVGTPTNIEATMPISECIIVATNHNGFPCKIKLLPILNLFA